MPGPNDPRPNESRSSRSARQFGLAPPNSLPDPTRHAYRKDLADIALAGAVIASHYAAPVERRLRAPARLLEQPSEGSSELALLDKGESFELLDDSLGWAWGYGGKDRRVGYVRSECLEA